MCGAFLFLQINVGTGPTLIGSRPALALKDNPRGADDKSHWLIALLAKLLRLVAHAVNDLNNLVALCTLIIIRWHVNLAYMLSVPLQERTLR